LNDQLQQESVTLLNDRIRQNKLKNDLNKLKEEQQQSKSQFDSVTIERQSMTNLIKELQAEIEEEKNSMDSLNKTYSTNTND